MNSRVKIVKRGTLELPQSSELNEKHAAVSSDHAAVVIKRWIADHHQRRSLEETQHWEVLIKLGR